MRGVRMQTIEELPGGGSAIVKKMKRKLAGTGFEGAQVIFIPETGIMNKEVRCS